jgi:AmmeMemoRadiSam system protein A
VAQGPLESAGLEALPGVAREAILARVEQREPRLPAGSPGAPSLRAPVFVTIRLGGTLRGCVGSLTPRFENVVIETAYCARLAAFEDTRFPPLTREELDECTIEVSILGPMEPAGGPADLEPAIYGVVVTGKDGRRGVLLPGLEEIDSPEQQLEIARRKGGIDEHAPATIQRFRVVKVPAAAPGAGPAAG